MLHELVERAAQAKSEDQAFAIVADVLAAIELDLPFVLLYAANENGDEARLVGSGDWNAYEGPAKPVHIRLNEPTRHSWPLADAVRASHEVVVEDLHARFGPLPAGSADGVPERAIVLPLSRAGQSTPYAFLVSGLSPHRAFDDRYRRFFRASAERRTGIASCRSTTSWPRSLPHRLSS